MMTQVTVWVPEWHGTWRPLEIAVYDEWATLLGPSVEMVAVEMRCGKTYSVRGSGFRAADRHEEACGVGKLYRGKNA